MHPIFTSLLVLLLLPTLFAVPTTCDHNVSHYVPAVVGESGGLVKVNMAFVPPRGPGEVFVSIYPRVGLMTQDSIEQALGYAYAAAGKSGERPRCDVIVSFDTPGATGYVDGPSAGVALTMMAYSLVEDKPLRGDTIITGAIDPGGNVAPVGGLYEKGREAARIGAKYFVTPIENLYELLLLRNLEKETGIIVLQAKTISEVVGFMTANQTIAHRGIEATMRTVPNVPVYTPAGMDDFGPVALRMISIENSIIPGLVGDDNDTVMIRAFFNNEVARQKGILAKGYLFSAANEAFLSYIDLSTIKLMLAKENDLARSKGDVGKCVSNIHRPAMTKNDFEWVIGGDLRSAWALDKLDKIEVDGQTLSEERYKKYNDLMYSSGWCIVSKELYATADTVNARNASAILDETLWKAMAERELSKAASHDPVDDDVRTRLGIARDSYVNKRYGAAIFDSVYVTTMNDVSQTGMGSTDALKGNVSILVSVNRTSLWGNVYQSQGAFLYAQNDYGSAYRVLKLAESLDAASNEMRSVAGSSKGTNTKLFVADGEEGVDLQTLAFVTGIAFVATGIVLVGAMMFLKGGKRRYGTNNQRARKVYRTSEKEGGA